MSDAFIYLAAIFAGLCAYVVMLIVTVALDYSIYRIFKNSPLLWLDKFLFRKGDKHE